LKRLAEAIGLHVFLQASVEGEASTSGMTDASKTNWNSPATAGEASGGGKGRRNSRSTIKRLPKKALQKAYTDDNPPSDTEMDQPAEVITFYLCIEYPHPHPHPHPTPVLLLQVASPARQTLQAAIMHDSTLFSCARLVDAVQGLKNGVGKLLGEYEYGEGINLENRGGGEG